MKNWPTIPDWFSRPEILWSMVVEGERSIQVALKQRSLELGGELLLDVRQVYTDPQGNVQETRKGVWIPVDSYEEVSHALATAFAKAQRASLETEDSDV